MTKLIEFIAVLGLYGFHIEQQKAVAFILLPLCRCLVLTMELAAAQVTAILTSLISSFVGVPMYGKISVSFIEEWHSTSCMATPTTTSAITVSCLPRNWQDTLSCIRHQSWRAKSHQYLLIDSYTEESDINVLLSASVSYMLVPKKNLRLLRMFMPHQRLAQNRY